MNKTKISFQKNSFDILKYWAAFSVMFLHYTYYAFMEASQAWGFMDKLRMTSQFFPGVVVLFSISGFLISFSMEHSKSRSEFLKKRVLRLYPELWLCTIINLVLLAVLAREQLDSSILLWIGTQILGIANTPSCLKEFATGSVNGALWTIFVEIQLYLLLCFGYKFVRKFKIYHWGIALGGLVGANLLCDYLTRQFGGVVAKLIERSFFPYAIWFGIGVFCYQYKERMLGILRWTTIPLLILYWYLWSFDAEPMGYYTGIWVSILCPFIVIGLAYLLPPIRLKKELSYGMFLYHWIVLNFLVYFQLLDKWRWYVSFGFFIVMTLALAWGSQAAVGKILNLWKRKLQISRGEPR